MKQIGEHLPQVAEVMPVKLLMTACGSTTDVMAMHGVDKDLFTSFYKYDIPAQALADFREDKSGALAERKIAERYGWKIGQQISLEELNNVSFQLRGIFETESASQDNLILADRRFLQETVEELGIANHVLVKLKPGADPAAVSEAIDAMPFTVETITQPEHVFLADAFDQLMDLVSVSKVVISVIIVVMLVAIGNAISMATRERFPEFGILRTLGFGKSAILLMVVTEGMVQTFIGGVIGCGLVQLLISFGGADTIPTWGTALSISMSPGVNTWVMGVALVTLAGACGSILPAWTASRVDICAVIKQEE